MWDIIKKPFNLGSQLIISLEAFELLQHDLIKGVVRLTCPEYTLSGDSVSIELKEFRRESFTMHQPVTAKRTIEKTILHHAFNFAPASKLEFPFQIRLPRNCRLTMDGEGWYLEARVDMPGALDLKARRNLIIAPAKELLNIVEACEEILGFREKQGERKWDGSTMKTHFHLVPPKVYKSCIDYMVLGINIMEDGSIGGDILFNLQEKSFGDYVKAYGGKDFVNKDFCIEASRLYKESGQFGKEYVANVIADELSKLMKIRE